MPDVKDAVVNFASQKAYIQLGPAFNDLTSLQVAVEKAGYSSTPYVPQYRAAKMYESEQSRLGWRLAFSGILALPFLAQHLLMLFSSFVLSPLVQFFLAAPVFFLVGWPFHLSAVKGLGRGEATMDTLISLGTSAAFFSSLPALAGYPVDLYFDASTLILFFCDLRKNPRDFH